MKDYTSADQTKLPRTVPKTAQRSLALELAPSSPEVPAVAEESDFIDPDTSAMFFGDIPWQQYLEDAGHDWVVRMRDLLGQTDLSGFYANYRRGGRQALHPRILLSLIIYGMLRRQSSLREIEQLARLDVAAMWLCGGRQPDHSTIGNFINRHAELLSEAYFIELTSTIIARLKLTVGTVAADGTVIEAAASRYNTIKAEAARQAATEAAAQAKKYPTDEYIVGKAAATEEVARTVEQRTTDRAAKGKKAAHVRVAVSEPEAMVQPLKNKCMRPSYKPSIMVNSNKLIVGKYLHPSSEPAALRPMPDQHKKIFGENPKNVLLDAGYHNQATFKLSLSLDLDILCPSGRPEGDGRWERQSRSGRLLKDQFIYDESNNSYRCPADKNLRLVEASKDAAGRNYRRYRCRECATCELRAHCTKDKNGRTIKRYDGDELKDAMKQVLENPRARKAYRQRQAIAEPPFAELRERQGLKRFRRRGEKRVTLEFSIHCMALNIKTALGIERKMLLGAAIICVNNTESTAVIFYCAISEQ